MPASRICLRKTYLVISLSWLWGTDKLEVLQSLAMNPTLTGAWTMCSKCSREKLNVQKIWLPCEWGWKLVFNFTSEWLFSTCNWEWAWICIPPRKESNLSMTCIYALHIGNRLNLVLNESLISGSERMRAKSNSVPHDIWLLAAEKIWWTFFFFFEVNV